MIRIYTGCEVRIENSVTRVTFRHHEACRVMPNIILSDGILNSHRTTITDSFSCKLFLRQLYLSMNMHYFIKFMLKYVYFRRSRGVLFSCYQKTTSCMTSGRSYYTTSWHHAIGHLTSPSIRRKYPERVKIAENLVGYARKHSLLSMNWLIIQWAVYVPLNVRIPEILL